MYSTSPHDLMNLYLHAKYVPHKHAEQVAGICVALASAAGHLCYANI